MTHDLSGAPTETLELERPASDSESFAVAPSANAPGQSVLDFIGLLADERVKFAVREGVTNHGVYEERLSATPNPVQNFDYVPRCMYFYYVRIDASGKLKISHFFHVDGDINDKSTWQPIPYDRATLETIVQTLAKNARRLAPTAPPPLPQINFKNIVWDRKGYIAIFVDEANWSFHEKGNTQPAVIFDPAKGSVENHSFFDAMNMRITMPVRRPPGTDTRSAIVFVNHLKEDEAGTDLGSGLPAGQIKTENFQFEMFLSVAFADGTDAPMTVIFDPGGTNQGPPEMP
jgi:hypothetical protein